MKFLRSPHVLALLLTLLAIELGMRMGVYEPFASPASHSGVTIKLKRAIEDFGKDRVNVVTLGDSRAVQGLDNRLIYSAATAQGINHLRMSMPGSQLLTFKTLSAWSIDELPALQGVVLAVSADVFGRLGSGAYELAEVLPLRNKTSIRELLHHVPFNSSDLRTYTAFYSIAGYREDISNLLADPAQRLNELLKRNKAWPLSFLAYNARNSSNICAVATRDPVACLEELQRVRDDIPDKAWNGLDILCTAATQSRQDITPDQHEQELINEWSAFLRNLSRKVRVMVVLLPDHSLFMKHLYPPKAANVAQNVLAGLQSKGLIDLVDLHQIMIEQKAPECSYYMDARHLNKRGKQRLTETLLPHLQAFWAQLDVRETRQD